MKKIILLALFSIVFPKLSFADDIRPVETGVWGGIDYTAFSDDGKLALACNNGMSDAGKLVSHIYIFDVSSETRLGLIEGTGVTAADFSNDNKNLLVSTNYEGLLEYRLSDFKKIRTILEPPKEKITPKNNLKGLIYRVNYSPKGDSAVLGMADGTVEILDLKKAKVTKTYTGHPLGSIVFRAEWVDDKTIFSWTVKGAHIWDAKSGKVLSKFDAKDGDGPLLADFSRKAGVVFTSTNKESVIWPLKGGDALAKSDTGSYRNLAISPSGNLAFLYASEGLYVLKKDLSDTHLGAGINDIQWLAIDQQETKVIIGNTYDVAGKDKNSGNMVGDIIFMDMSRFSAVDSQSKTSAK